ncbi:Rossmann fold domain-containing protein [Aurantiacibacter spongiae]|uniref:Short chain dehydrogenase-like proteobacteria domain-containing protein n=1 Tax=Aurantiacibacter spongiae TaxID=2488860 RepID=A0A3N5DGM5_9SPHN|nr:hypothetical protein [Aurantiacibacter spongiae]RPF70832.1 hypothetical protein EG799_03745 [Aurantiacibacter spongiae]
MGAAPGGQDVWEARGLPAAPLDALAAFTAEHLPALRRHGGIVLFDPADHTHDAWREAVIGELAREAAPARVNAIVGTDEEGIRRTVAFLDSAPGVTGQVLVVDGN